jgi:HlyD family secretion protein
MRSVLVGSMLLAAAACTAKEEPAAYGNFEANEVVVSSQATGQLESFTVTEGTDLRAGAIIAIVDTTQLALERAQVVAQRQATEARAAAAGGQVGVYASQLDVAKRSFERQQRLFAQKATTAQQFDQAERDLRTVQAQVRAASAQQASVQREVASSTAHIEQIRDRISKSKVSNPVSGTVLATFVRAGEVVQPGQPLYRIARLDTLTLRAYVTEPQLSLFKLGQHVQVHVDRDGTLSEITGTVTWVSSKAEFTPTPVQTRDERADLVYAVKVSVPNPKGALKIGMPADLRLASGSKGT